MTETSQARVKGASRRAVVGGVVGLGVGVPLLASCGSDSGGGSGGSGGAGDADSAGSTTASGPIGKTADVPVGSGKIYASEKVVVTQPSAGEFKAFSAICTHQGCPVSKIEGTDITCTCHGSKFSIADGSVTNGPASKSLDTLKVTVTGEDLSVS